MRVHPSQNGILKRALEVEGGCEANQPRLAQRLEHSTDVLVLVFDCLCGPIDPVCKLSI